VSRGIAPPDLADDVVRLEPLGVALKDEMAWLVEGDEEIRRFTLLPSKPTPDFVETWLRSYDDGWADGSRAGFAVRDAEGGDVIGFGGFVRLDLDEQQGEAGYVLREAGRGRGAATRLLLLVSRWGFEELGLERIELRIDTDNAASVRVAERSGYRLDGVLRNLHFKEGRRSDVGVWSRLSHD
jgi:RimJ/RimL family protein N-acetyltransferase